MKNNNELIMADESGIRFFLFVYPPQNAECILEPVDELITYIKKAMNMDISRYDQEYPVAMILRIDPFAELENDSFTIRTSDSDLTLTARTCNGMFNAVYYFLEKALGIRWLWPGSVEQTLIER